MRSATIALLLVASVAATLFAWIHIWRSADPRPFKSILALVAAIPLLGPIMWFFIATMPSVRPGAPPPPFRGPIDPNPVQPVWLAASHKALAVVFGFAVIAAHVCFALALARGV
jgi:hypothetical protein